MSVPPECPKRKEMRNALLRLEKHIQGLEPDHQIEIGSAEIDQIRFLPMVVDESSEDRPAFFTLMDGTFLPIPDDQYDREDGEEYVTYDSIPEDCRDPKRCTQAIEIYWSTYISRCSFSAKPPGGEFVWSPVQLFGSRVYKGKHLWRFDYPEFGLYDLQQVKEGPYAHLKATIYNNLNADDGHICQGEMLLIVRLMKAHLRWARFIDHMVAPMMVFSLMGPMHARVIEAYVEGHNVVVRPTKLYDLRTKDAATLKMFAQWYFGKPRGPTGTSH